ncbi:hypothetical protein TIFTF001_038717 [Ficus carica]|uniref:Retrotransposon gag domain-containing protein n=1 Tax=Ficus carica TaxID=3494 RepID=A0AA88EIZ7_FICCA|nr:hypothetical protein TIFTF001_038717 [Ficus carica]
MVRPRKQVNLNPQEPDLANVVATLQRQLLEQQQETNRLREQMARLNQVPQANEVPLQDNPVPPTAPPAPGVRQGVPRNLEVPLVPDGIQVNPPLVQEDLLRFRRMKAPEFEGTTDPIETDNWLIDIQVILDFMGITEREKVLCASFALKNDARHWWMTVQMRRDVAAMSWQDFVTEFKMMYYNSEILAAQQDEFTSMKQGSMTVLEAVKKFEQLARLCPELIPNETTQVRRMMKMFRTDIAKQVSAGSSPPTLVSDCISRAIRAEYWINQDKEARAQIFKAKKEEKAVVKQLQPRQNQEMYPKGQTNNSGQNSKQFGKNKIKGNATGQSQQRNYPQKKNNRGNEGYSNDYPMSLREKLHHEQSELEPSSRNANSRLHAVQAKIEGPSIAQGKLEAPKPQARIYAYTRGDAEARTSHVVTGQIFIATYDAIALFDYGATHSFVSMEFARKLVIVCGRELYVDLIAIKLQDYDVILEMDFLSKYNAKIDCRKRCVMFSLHGEEEFNFYGQSRNSSTKLVSAMKACKMLAGGCQ